jgi:hypothetical protein
MKSKLLLISLMAFQVRWVSAQEYPQVHGIFPHTTVSGNLSGRSETGIGALIPWADRLWAVGYVAHIFGSGIGLYEMDEKMNFKKRPESITGTFANRMVHDPSNQAIIGPHIIDIQGNVRTFTDLGKHRLTATMKHLQKPDSMVFFLTMEGLLFEANVYSLQTKQVANLVTEFYQKSYEQLKSKGIYIHFKGGYTANGKVIVANNSYQNEDYIGKLKGGRLAEWDGKTWSIVDSTAYIEVNGKPNPIYGNGIWAIGWDRKSVKMMFQSPETKGWRTYRLPKGSQAWEHAWNTEWMRIREAQTERFMVDAFGIFYEMPVMVYGGNPLPMKPVCNHLRVIPDYVSWRGFLVLASDQGDNAVGQPQSNLMFSHPDQLWSWGKPSGWGSVWQEENLNANQISDPYLMNGFDRKTVHFKAKPGKPASFDIEVDLLGNNEWVTYKTISIDASGYGFHVFPSGYSAKWVRFKTKQPVEKVTVHLTYE